MVHDALMRGHSTKVVRLLPRAVLLRVQFNRSVNVYRWGRSLIAVCQSKIGISPATQMIPIPIAVLVVANISTAWASLPVLIVEETHLLRMRLLLISLVVE